MKLVVAPLVAPSYLGQVGSRPSDPATAIGAPRADTSRGFRVGRSIFDATRHAGVFVVPVAPANAMGSPSVVTGLFSAVNRGPLFRRLIPSAGAARHHPICPGPTPDPKNIAQPTDGVRKGSAKSWADGSRCYGQQRSHPTGWKTVHRLNFLSIGGWYSRSRVNSPSPTAISE